jgi:hypothetical protein
MARNIAFLIPQQMQLSGFESRHLSKIPNGRRRQRSGQHTLARQKINKTRDFEVIMTLNLGAVGEAFFIETN